ncbi:Cell division protein FtsQ [Georgfuchsia toluolica]|uniref:Cell division protein FtsQ n=1 Tax=Georgfuchsia toluolica TaxID=424218 RepID=A0A916J508_9PROT|nr:cell division protein FtsQ/DivIB [Georgfuchsia toluolica]CAG4884118.1 Cell division protein FtsQ [Georgfuchsia toluolica]
MAKANSKPSKRGKKPQAAADTFWDRPPLMNLLADVLLIFALTALAYAALVGVQRLPVFPLRQLVVASNVRQVTSMQIEYAARSSVAGNFFTVNLGTVRASFEKLPWVRHAEVRRIWPDGIEVSIEEQVAAARWREADGEYRLVNTFGEVFVAASESDLPVFSGPEGSAAQMLARWQEFILALAALGRQPGEMVLSQRQAWQVKLDNGLLLLLGRDDTAHPVSERLARFVAAYPELEQKLHFRPGMIDMRYPNGFTVREAHT